MIDIIEGHCVLLISFQYQKNASNLDQNLAPALRNLLLSNAQLFTQCHVTYQLLLSKHASPMSLYLYVSEVNIICTKRNAYFSLSAAGYKVGNNEALLHGFEQRMDMKNSFRLIWLYEYIEGATKRFANPNRNGKQPNSYRCKDKPATDPRNKPKVPDLHFSSPFLWLNQTPTIIFLSPTRKNSGSNNPQRCSQTGSTGKKKI